MYEAFIVDGIRSPIAKFKGSLSTIRTDDLAALIIREILERNSSIPYSDYDEVILGCANQAGEDNRNVARMASLLAGLPASVPGETINRLCASGMSAIINAARAIHCGDGDLFIAGGVENMTRGPWILSKSSQAFGRDMELFDSSFGWRFINPKLDALYGSESMGNTAENLVQLYNILRSDQDEFAYNSQIKATESTNNGRLSKEIVEINIPRKKDKPYIFDKDEYIRPGTSIEALAKLRSAFKKDGTVTAGNSSGLNDGAAMTLIASQKAIKKYNLKPIAKILTSAVVGVEPRIMGIGPVNATYKALKKVNLKLDDMEVIELNEAFAAQSLAVIKEWGLAFDDPRINPNGGAIALGHPLGMSGTRITHSCALELQAQNKRYGLATMCVGVGQGYAVILENCN